MTTIPNPLDAQHEELVIARLARDMAQSELDDIATALFVRANITITTDVADAVNELLDSWDKLYEEKVEGLRIKSEQALAEMRERMNEHKASLIPVSEFRKRWIDDTDGKQFTSGDWRQDYANLPRRSPEEQVAINNRAQEILDGENGE